MLSHMDELIDDILRKDYPFEIDLPRMPARWVRYGGLAQDQLAQDRHAQDRLAQDRLACTSTRKCTHTFPGLLHKGKLGRNLTSRLASATCLAI